MLELAFEGGAVGLGGTAAEVFYVVGGRPVMLSHRGMVREVLCDEIASLQEERLRQGNPTSRKGGEKWGTRQSFQTQSQSQKPRARVPAPHESLPTLYAVAAVLRDWKHSRQKTGRPCVGRKGTVVCFPHPEQVA